MLNPLFSAKHLREMTPIFNTIVHRVSASYLCMQSEVHPRGAQLLGAISSRVENGSEEIDVLGWMARAALELIGQGGLGYSFDPLTEDKADEFADSIKAFLYVLVLPLLA